MVDTLGMLTLALLFPSLTHLLGALEESVEGKDGKDDRMDVIILGVSGERISIILSK